MIEVHFIIDFALIDDGRSIAALMLSRKERSYLERQFRRHHVARSLSERCRKQLRRGVHTSTNQLETDIRAFIQRHNEAQREPKALQMDQICGRNSRLSQTVLSENRTDIMQRTLDSGD